MKHFLIYTNKHKDQELTTTKRIQNYLETVDKIFVFANPNKKNISIQEFEKPEFEQLKEDLAEEEEE